MQEGDDEVNFIYIPSECATFTRVALFTFLNLKYNIMVFALHTRHI